MKRADIVKTILPYVRELREVEVSGALEIVTIKGEKATKDGEYVLIQDIETLVACHEAALEKYTHRYLSASQYPGDNNELVSFVGVVLHPVNMSAQFLDHARTQIESGRAILMNKVGGSFTVTDPKITSRRPTTIAAFFGY